MEKTSRVSAAESPHEAFDRAGRQYKVECKKGPKLCFKFGISLNGALRGLQSTQRETYLGFQHLRGVEYYNTL
jgi:hypothetical protein